MTECGCEFEASNERERLTLRIVLGINAFMFVLEIILGILAQSTGLIADSLDMLADASVYGISLYAVGKTIALKAKAARISGVCQVFLAFIVMGDVVRRSIFGSDPVSGLMMGVGFAALVANVACLLLISRHSGAGAHMRAAVIFSTNDVIANMGVILAGALVWGLHTRIPDLVIGVIVAMVVLRGGIQIIRDPEGPCDCHDQHG